MPSKPTMTQLAATLFRPVSSSVNTLTTTTSSIDPIQLFSASRCIILGEQHHQPYLLAAQVRLLSQHASYCHKHDLKLFLVLEHFSILQQPLLDAFAREPVSASTTSTDTSNSNTNTSADTLIQEYARGDEGFDIAGHYGYLLAAARKANVRVMGGFPPRAMAKRATGGNPQPWHEAVRLGWLKTYDEQEVNHKTMVKQFAYFESCLRGDIHWRPESFADQSKISQQPNNLTNQSDSNTNMMAQRIFPAQVFKDAVMAHQITRILAADSRHSVMAICGNGHADWRLGIPERVEREMALTESGGGGGGAEINQSNGNERTERPQLIRAMSRRVFDALDRRIDDRMCDAVLVYDEDDIDSDGQE